MSGQRGKFAVTFIFITVFIDMVGFGLVMPVLPRLIEEVSGSDLEVASIWVGWLFFAHGDMQFLFGPAIGSLSDAYGQRPVLLISVFGIAVDYLLTAFAPSMLWLIIGRIFAGICGASSTRQSASCTLHSPL
jgi:DHA1 family tetracycline resistance protein-like MFS transporter